MELQDHEERDQGIKAVRKYTQTASRGCKTEEKEIIKVYSTFLLAKGRNSHHQHSICPDRELEMLMVCHTFYLSAGLTQRCYGRGTESRERGQVRERLYYTVIYTQLYYTGDFLCSFFPSYNTLSEIENNCC